MGAGSCYRDASNASAFHSNAAQMPWVAHDTRVIHSPGSSKTSKTRGGTAQSATRLPRHASRSDSLFKRLFIYPDRCSSVMFAQSKSRTADSSARGANPRTAERSEHHAQLPKLYLGGIRVGPTCLATIANNSCGPSVFKSEGPLATESLRIGFSNRSSKSSGDRVDAL